MTDRPIHPATAEILRYFEYDHLRPDLVAVSQPICELAHAMAARLNGPELNAGLRKLLEAKDCLVRAAITTCHCPAGMKYHAINCASGHGQLMNPESGS